MKIDQDVLDVLSQATATGALLMLPGQLDRKLYLKVDRVLQACGGKWNRGKKAHLFPGDAADHVDTVIALGEVTTAREVGFFETAPKLADVLVDRAGVKAGDLVLEPSAGTGRIVAAIRRRGGLCTAVERDAKHRLDLRRCEQGSNEGPELMVITMDFMAYAPVAKFDAVVMNPPFNKVDGHDQLDHVRHAASLLQPDGLLVSVLSAGVMFRSDKRHTAFRAWAEERGDFEMLPEGSFKESGTNVSTCVLRYTAP